MEWPGQVPRGHFWVVGSRGGCLRHKAQPAEGSIAGGSSRWRALLRHRRHDLQILAPDHGPATHRVPVVCRRDHLTVYPVLAVGLLLLARAQVPDGDQASLLDALTITLGVGLLSWIFLIGPDLRTSGGLLVRFTPSRTHLGTCSFLRCWHTFGAPAAFATPQAGCSRQGHWERLPLTRCTRWPTAPELELERRQRGRSWLDHLLCVLGRGGAASVDALIV